MGFLFVCLGAALGAPARYLTDRAVQARHDSLVPWGTLIVNVTGSLLLGLLTGLAGDGHLPSWVTLVAGTGFCGALTTYSTFTYETFRLGQDGAWLYAFVNVATSLAAGMGAAVLGYAVGSAL
jgi:CrcB protein